MRQVMLVARNGLVEAFAVGKSAEVEATSPSVFVNIRSQIIVTTLISIKNRDFRIQWLTVSLR